MYLSMQYRNIRICVFTNRILTCWRIEVISKVIQLCENFHLTEDCLVFDVYKIEITRLAGSIIKQ